MTRSARSRPTARRRLGRRRHLEPAQRLLDLLDDGAWDWDLRRGEVRHNAAWCRLLGFGDEMRVHGIDAFWALVHPQDAARVRATFEDALRTGLAVQLEYRMRHADGRYRWLADRGVVVAHDAAGRPRRMFGRLVDVSAERGRLQAHADDVQRLELALIAGEIGSWDRDCTSGRLVVNERWKAMLGLADHHPVASIDDWLPLVHPDDRTRLEAAVAQAIAPGGPRDFALELRARHAAGHWIWILHQGLVAQRDAHGAALRLIGTHRDITQRKDAERTILRQREQLHTVVDSALDAIVTLDANFKVVVFNRAAERMFGVPAHEVLGGSFDRFMPEHMRGGMHERRMAQFAAAGHQTQIASRNRETMARRGDGSAFPIEASVARSGDGDGVLLTAVIRDITEVHRAREAVLEKDRAEQANRAKSVFLARVSHELRTPLNAILGFAELMHDAEPAVARRQLAPLQQAGRRLLALVNDLLDLGRIEAGKQTFELRPTRLLPALAQVVQLVDADASRRGVQVRVEVGDEALAAQVDRRALDQILLNLLSNALKFSPAGGIVRLGAHADAAQPERVQIEVRDEGPGIPADRLGELFRPYGRLSERDHGVPGTGLGLAISRELALQMGGELSVASPPAGGGACMRLSLVRAAAAPEADPAEPACAAGPTAPPAVTAEPGHALLVEDDPTSALLMTELFRIAGGWTLQVVEDIPAALAALSVDTFALVLTDIDVHGEDGVRVIEAARALAAPPTVIAVTANAMATQVERVCAAGAAGCWTKPVDVPRALRLLRAPRAAWSRLLRESA